MTKDRFAVYIEQYRFESDWSIVPGESGMNNTTVMIEAGSRKYVLREYNNHKDSGTVQFEHEILKALQQVDKPFRTPVPVPNSKGDTVSAAPDGTLAALYEFIPGNRPTMEKIAHIRTLGRAVSGLSLAFSQIKPKLAPAYSPYYELDQNYASVTDSEISSLQNDYAEIGQRAEKLSELLLHREQLRTRLSAIRDLPSQWIHGDVNFSNAVAAGDEVIGLLDFEFCTVDVRAMELAVVIVDLISEKESLNWERIDVFCSGYSGGGRPLTASEAELLPALILLRMLDVTLHFASRLLDKLDMPSTFGSIIDQASRVCEWTAANEKQLVELFYRRLVEFYI
ncbi:phosphotransferase [Paenibacillus sp. NEAU-GSW1]|uniref:phosphotransferase n=1 Tax=Paenibacillus sp. NEAU-GSW1 TaxID=2682486 RepID=UPI001566F112|nr:phosphotransferase [Paenibacillus sp. NEAU-GSW1]